MSVPSQGAEPGHEALRQVSQEVDERTRRASEDAFELEITAVRGREDLLANEWAPIER